MKRMNLALSGRDLNNTLEGYNKGAPITQHS
jgi:hypothetical protein